MDAEWEEEWQGPIFGVHVGLDPQPLGPPRVLRVGDVVTVSARREDWAAWALRLRAWLLTLMAVAAAALALVVAQALVPL